MNTDYHPAVQEQIAALAHQFWESEGRPEGKAEKHWQRAEEHVVQSLRGSAASDIVLPNEDSSVGPGSDSLTL